MGERSKIEWTDATVNFWIGCTKVSAACDHCYAEAMASRFGLAKWGHGQQRQRVGSAVETAFKLERKAQRQGRRLKVFSNSMSDFFDAEVPHEWRDEAFAVMALTPNLDWMILTKRPKVMREYMWSPATVERVYDLVCDMAVSGAGDAVLIAPGTDPSFAPPGTRVRLGVWPLPNVWLGVTAENQPMADLRIPELQLTPAAKRFVSVEPMLGPIDLSMHLDLYSYEEGHWAPRHPDGQPAPGIDWIICGGESGPQARPMHPDWARSLRDQCQAAGVPFFFKQWGEWAAFIDRDREDPDWRGDYHSSSRRPDRYRILNLAGGCGFHGDRVHLMYRVGKERAGRLLDGREWSEVPA